MEDQAKFVIPINRETENIYYNQRIILDIDGLLSEPRAWRVSKINRIDSRGVIIITLAQDKFDPNADYLDSEGVWWADWFTQSGNPAIIDEPEPIDNVYGVISCAGSQNIKVNGSYKKLKISYFNKDKEIETLKGNWSFCFNNSDISNLIAISTNGVADNEIKIKFLGDSSYIGKEIEIRYTPTGIGERVSFNLSVVSL